MTPEEQAKLDQGFAMIADNLCPLWFRMYTRLEEEGFDSIQSFKLVQTYILSQCSSGIRGDDG